MKLSSNVVHVLEIERDRVVLFHVIVITCNLLKVLGHIWFSFANVLFGFKHAFAVFQLKTKHTLIGP